MINHHKTQKLHNSSYPISVEISDYQLPRGEHHLLQGDHLNTSSHHIPAKYIDDINAKHMREENTDKEANMRKKP